jgi:hypothetical protein
MKLRGFYKPIWLNESGVPAWDDYPGPVWQPLSALRATQEEQAALTIQSAFFALSASADALFYFQLYDGCGNQPVGTDFPPHNGELCDANDNYEGKPCAGDAYGLYRNPTDAQCFTQHPNPESPRPSFDAYKVLTTYVKDVEPYWQAREGQPIYTSTCPWTDGTQEWIALYQPATKKRIVGMWARCGRDETAVIKATDPSEKAVLVAPDGTTQQITASGGYYSVNLPRATNRNPNPGQTINPVYGIGGRPYILIETDLRDSLPTPTATAISPPTCNQVIQNGGFEINASWDIPYTPFPAAYSSERARSGIRSMRAGITNPTENVYSYSTARQTVTVPTNANDYKLNFWLYTQTAETSTVHLPQDLLSLDEQDALTTSDRQMVLILNSGGAIVVRLLVDRLNNQTWREYSFDLAHYAGQTIQIYFGVYNNGSDGVTAMYVDDVSLGTCESTPTATPTATATPEPSQNYEFFAPILFNDYPLGISGRILDESGRGAEGILIRLNTGPTTTSDTNGDYAFTGLGGGSYTVFPEKAGCTFQPPSHTISLPSSGPNQDFLAITSPFYPGPD